MFFADLILSGHVLHAFSLSVRGSCIVGPHTFWMVFSFHWLSLIQSSIKLATQLKLSHPLRKAIWENILRDTECSQPSDPVILLLGLYLKEIIRKKEKKFLLIKELFIMSNKNFTSKKKRIIKLTMIHQLELLHRH